MAFKKFRKMKVYNVSGYNYKDTPTIILKGDWLKETGFDIGSLIQVECENGKLIITLVLCQDLVQIKMRSSAC